MSRRTMNLSKALAFPVALSCLGILAGCLRETEIPGYTESDLRDVVFHAGWAPETRTELQEDGSVWWSPGDEISLFVGSGGGGGYKLTATNTEPAAKVDFYGQINDETENPTYVAIYPYNSSANYDGSTLCSIIPLNQIAKERSLAENAFLSYAVSRDDHLYFKNISSGIKFSVAHDNITKIVISPCNNSWPPIAGEVGITDLDKDEPVIHSYGPANPVTLEAPDGECFKIGSYYYASLCPNTHDYGLWIEYFTDDNQVAKAFMPGPVEFHRGVFKRLYEKDNGLTFRSYHESTANLYAGSLLPEGVDKDLITNISFIVNSDKTTDTSIYTNLGEPIYFELDGTTAKYYTPAVIYDLRCGDELFCDWTSLREVDLSNIETSHVTSMANMFGNCGSLKSITFGDFITENVVNMFGMFSGCWSLESLDLSGFQTGSVTDMGWMFSGCSSLKTLDLSSFDTSHVSSMTNMFAYCESLQSITFGDFITENVVDMFGMFSECWSLESLDLSGFQTGSVTDMGWMFSGCSSLKTLDLSSFDTSNVEQMGFMFGTTGGVGPNKPWCQAGMTGCSSLESLDLHTFNTSKVKFMGGMFSSCYNLKTVNLSGWNTSCVENMGDMFVQCTSLESVDLSSFDTRNVTWMGHMFECCTSLKSLDLSNFETPNLTSMQDIFYGCESLQTLNISHFDSSSLTDPGQFLVGTHSLKQLDLGTFDLSTTDLPETAFNGVARQSKNVAIRCIETTKHTLEAIANEFFKLDYVTWVGLGESFPELPPDIIDPDLYYSTDFSMDKQVVTLQTATTGNGVDIVIMGDAYSDRLIADGTYEHDMREAMEALFSIEPMNSYRDLFNVNMVYAVSKNEDHNGMTVFQVQSYDDYVGGDMLMSNVYTKVAVPGKSISDVATIVIGHDTDAFVGALGTTWINYVTRSDQFFDYGPAQSGVAFIGRWEESTYAYTTVHEFGHLFAKLADEYVTKDEAIGENDEYEIQNEEGLMLHLGINKNVDFTSDPETIKWSRFLKDSRYASEDLGIFEGGLLYARGVWRPSEDSIMRNAWTKFNAPSREAIYNRIHKLAYGDSWQYDYETFVQQDLKNIGPATRSSYVEAPYPARIDRKHFFKIEQSTLEDGRKSITLIMD